MQTEQYRQTRERREKTAAITGIAATIAVHVLFLIIGLGSGLTYLDPPPPERAPLIIEFDDSPIIRDEYVPKTEVGQRPVSEEPDPDREVELVQRAESPEVGNRPNDTPVTAPDPYGDVEVPTPEVEEEPVLDPRAAFPGMSRKDSPSTTPHNAEEEAPSFKAGQADGNSPDAKVDGSANANVKGRTTVGSLPRPAYRSQASGTVVVRIKVDQYGNVTDAVPGVEGTTITDKTLWTAARSAALKAHFNQTADAPAMQTGTITYIFKLR